MDLIAENLKTEKIKKIKKNTNVIKHFRKKKVNYLFRNNLLKVTHP